MKIQNLEQFLEARGLEYMVVIGPQWESEDAKGKQSEDRFYVLDSSLNQKHYVRSVWRKSEFSSAVQSALDEFDRHETKMIYSHDINAVKRQIITEGEKAYEAYKIKQQRGHDEKLKSDALSSDFKKIIKDLK